MRDPKTLPLPLKIDHSPVEHFAYDNRSVRDFLWATLLFGVVGMAAGVLAALQLAWPAANFDLPWTTYGRIRPLHTNAVIFAFAGNAIFAGIYWSLQRLCKARMYSDWLSRFHFWGWQAIIVAAAITLPLGITTSKEYAELEWPIDIAIAVVWIAFAINVFGTIARRRERHLYVAIWFYIATIVGIAMLHIVNSLAVPVSLTKSYPVFAGVQDALVQWWYGHNAVAFFLTTPFLGLMYYFLPKAAERPVYSYRLSIIHFWSLIFLYIWAGPHHLLHSALPEWAQTLGVAFSVMLIAPSWGGMINGLLTLRGAFDKVRTSPVLKFLVLAITAYGMATFEGTLLSLRSINAMSHDTDWTVGHVHSGALGWNGFLAFALVYWMVPRLYRRALWSTALANAHFWIATVGIVVYVVSMWMAGITQSSMWFSFNDQGRLQYRDWIEMIRAVQPFYWVRLAGGALYLGGIVLCCVNVAMTVRGATLLADEPAEAPALAPDTDHEDQIATALAIPDRRERGTALHRLIERWPTLLIILSTITLLIGGALEIIPNLIQGALSPRIASVQPYTPLELAGRDIYIREGCIGCHTQMIRTLRAETERYGEYTRAGEGIYDRPFLWGSKRTGPDLACEGVIRPMAAWHYQHMADPRAVAPGSVMPAYPWLLKDETDVASLPARMRALAGMPIYTPYPPPRIAGAVQEAKTQAEAIAAQLRSQDQRLAGEAGLADKEIVALIAYLQRLGTDLGKPTPAGK